MLRDAIAGQLEYPSSAATSRAISCQQWVLEGKIRVELRNTAQTNRFSAQYVAGLLAKYREGANSRTLGCTTNKQTEQVGG